MINMSDNIKEILATNPVVSVEGVDEVFNFTDGRDEDWPNMIFGKTKAGNFFYLEVPVFKKGIFEICKSPDRDEVVQWGMTNKARTAWGVWE